MPGSPRRTVRSRSTCSATRSWLRASNRTGSTRTAASGAKDDRPGLEACLRALRDGDVLVVWKLDRLGRKLAHLVGTVQDLSERGVGPRVLTGQGAQIDTTTPGGRLVFGIFAALAEFERELIPERTVAGLEAARARGRKGGRKFALCKAQVRLAQAAMASRDTSVAELCKELGIGRVTLYRHVDSEWGIEGVRPAGTGRERMMKTVVEEYMRLIHGKVVDTGTHVLRGQCDALEVTVRGESAPNGRRSRRGPSAVRGGVRRVPPGAA